MRVPRRYRDDICKTVWNLGLSIAIVPPSHHYAIGFKCQTVRAPCSNRHHVAQPCWNVCLFHTIWSPFADGGVALNCEIVTPCRHRHHVCQFWRDIRQAKGEVRLAEIVVAPSYYFTN